MPKKRYAIVGLGSRAGNFLYPMLLAHGEHCEIVAFCDNCQARMDYWNERLEREGNASGIPNYRAEQFEALVQETEPDCIVVLSKDSTHHSYIKAALEHGLEVITEKPMTIDADKCSSILEAPMQDPRQVKVAFNYRWAAYNTRVKELLNEGLIGHVLSVNMEYLLDTSHGADYYRRWHSSMAESGGLLVHKSTHHFDLVNWWLDAVPEEVFAYGDLVFYGEENARKRGDTHLLGYERYTGNDAAKEDPFALQLNDGDSLEGLYLKAEEESGYRRDQNVFRDDIDIYDSMSVNVRYRNGVLLTYSLNSFCPREGMRVTFNGERGRLEYYEFGGSHIIRGQNDEELAKEQRRDSGEFRIVHYPHFSKDAVEYEVVVPEGGHGGADPLLARQLYDPSMAEDTLGRTAGREQGAASILVGIAANHSIERGQPVRIGDLAPQLDGRSKLSELDALQHELADL